MSAFAPGDVVEVTLDAGRAYLQLTHEHPSYPPAIRAFAGLDAERPADTDRIAERDTLFTAMFPLAPGGRLKAEKVGHAPVPDAGGFPTFRMPIRDRTGAVVYWWFWDGHGLRYESEPSEVDAALPVREVLTTERLLDRLARQAATDGAG